MKQTSPLRFETYSAGASPKPAPYPLGIEILREDFRVDASEAYSKSWEEFKDAQFDFVITLCDNGKETLLAGRSANKTPPRAASFAAV